MIPSYKQGVDQQKDFKQIIKQMKKYVQKNLTELQNFITLKKRDDQNIILEKYSQTKEDQDKHDVVYEYVKSNIQ